MFKNIQKDLLLKNPLLWNSKIIPFAAIIIGFHIIFFILGYFHGEIDFFESENNYYRNNSQEISIFFSVLISIFTTIVWLVLYSRNNAFKSFYPKNKFSLYKEWLLILVFFLMNTAYPISYLYAKDFKARNYFSEEEIQRRCEVISLASIFVDGAYTEGNYIIKEIDGKNVQVKRDSFEYQNRKYSLKSLMNKKMESFRIFDQKKDSLQELKVKSWMVENKKDSIQQLFKDFLAISKEHRLVSNIDAKQWLNLVYDFPEFTNYKIVGRSQSHYLYENYYDDYEYAAPVEIPIDSTSSETEPIDTLSQTIKIVNGQDMVYSKYYVPYKSLKFSYSKIAKAWENPTVDRDMITFFLYFSICFSLAVFSFKVTSGRSWLIAVISLGVVSILAGIIAAISRYGMTFPIIYICLFGILFIYFLIILNSKTTKGISGIILNQLLWLFPAFIPALYFIVEDIIQEVSGYKSYYYNNYNGITKEFPAVEFMQENGGNMMLLNIAFIFIFMIISTFQIKKWKGIAED